MIDLSVVASLLPLVVKVGIGASSDSENCVVRGKVVGLMQRLIDL
jgi:hypothetical protein